MKTRLGERYLQSEDAPAINIAPLLDMVFILLIFFLVTAVFVNETGIEVEKPIAASAEALERESLLLGLGRDGRIAHAGRTLPLNSVRALVAQELAERPLPVIIIADRMAESGKLVDLIDECKLAGAKQVSVAAAQENAP